MRLRDALLVLWLTHEARAQYSAEELKQQTADDAEISAAQEVAQTGSDYADVAELIGNKESRFKDDVVRELDDLVTGSFEAALEAENSQFKAAVDNVGSTMANALITGDKVPDLDDETADLMQDSAAPETETIPLYDELSDNDAVTYTPLRRAALTDDAVSANSYWRALETEMDADLLEASGDVSSQGVMMVDSGRGILNGMRGNLMSGIEALTSLVAPYREETEQAMLQFESSLADRLTEWKYAQETIKTDLNSDFQRKIGYVHGSWIETLGRLRQMIAAMKSHQNNVNVQYESLQDVINNLDEEVIIAQRLSTKHMRALNKRLKSTIYQVKNIVARELKTRKKDARKVLHAREVAYQDQITDAEAEHRDLEAEMDQILEDNTKSWERDQQILDGRARRLEQDGDKQSALNKNLQVDSDEMMTNANMALHEVLSATDRALNLLSAEWKEGTSGKQQEMDTAVDTYSRRTVADWEMAVARLVAGMKKAITAMEPETKRAYRKSVVTFEKLMRNMQGMEGEIMDANTTYQKFLLRYDRVVTKDIPSVERYLDSAARQRELHIRAQMDEKLDSLTKGVALAAHLQRTVQREFADKVNATADGFAEEAQARTTRLETHGTSGILAEKNVLNTINNFLSSETADADARGDAISAALNKVVDQAKGIQSLVDEKSTQQRGTLAGTKDEFEGKINGLTDTSRSTMKQEFIKFAKNLRKETDQVRNTADELQGQVDDLKGRVQTSLMKVDKHVYTAERLAGGRLGSIQAISQSKAQDWDEVKENVVPHIEAVAEKQAKIERRLNSAYEDLEADEKRSKRIFADNAKESIDMHVQQFLNGRLAPVKQAHRQIQQYMKDAAGGTMDGMKSLQDEAGIIDDALVDLESKRHTATKDIDSSALAGIPALQGLETTVMDAKTNLHTEDSEHTAAEKHLEDVQKARTDEVSQALDEAAASAKHTAAQLAGYAASKVEKEVHPLWTWKDPGAATAVQKQAQVEDELRHLRAVAGDLRQDAEAITPALEAAAELKAGLVGNTSGTVDSTLSAERKASRLELEEETAVDREKLDTATTMLRSLGMVHTASDTLLNEAAKNWASQHNMAKGQSQAYFLEAEHSAKEVADVAGEIYSQMDDLSQRGNETASRVEQEIRESKEALASQLEEAADQIAGEKHKLRTTRAGFQHETEKSTSAVISHTSGIADGLLEHADNGDARYVTWSTNHKAYEQRMTDLVAVTRDQDVVDALTADTDALNADNAAIQHWASSLHASSSAYKTALNQQLSALGSEMPNTTTGALPHFSTADFADLSAGANQELTESAAHFDAQILAVLQDERLSEAEQRKQIAKLKNEQSAESARIHAEQLKAATAAAAASAAMDRFDALTNSSEKALLTVEHDLTPEARASRIALRNLTASLKTFESTPWLTSSALEIGDSPARLAPSPGLEPTNRALALANADLRAKIAKFEGVLGEH